MVTKFLAISMSWRRGKRCESSFDLSLVGAEANAFKVTEGWGCLYLCMYSQGSVTLNKETVVTGLKPLLRRQNGNIKDLSPCVFVWGKSMHPILDSIHNTCVDARRRMHVSVSPFNE